jgi:rRNA maturation endonuclease Nob1
MIKLELATLIFLYILFSVIGILVIWIFFGYKGIKRPPAKETDYVWKCSVCLNDYIDSKNEDISVCPLCGSYNKKEGISR